MPRFVLLGDDRTCRGSSSTSPVWSPTPARNMNSSQPRMKTNTETAIMPFKDLGQHDLDEGLTPGRPVGQRAHLDLPGHGVEKALHDEHGERQLDVRRSPASPRPRVFSRPIFHINEEDRNQQHGRRKGVQYQHRRQRLGAEAVLETGDVVAGQRLAISDGDDRSPIRR